MSKKKDSRIQTIRIADIPRIMRISMEARVPVEFRGPPGCGKTQGIKYFADTSCAGFVLLVCTQSEVTKLSGFHVPGKSKDADGNDIMITRATMSDLLRQVQAQVKAGKKRGIILIDEFAAADMLLKKALCSFISEREIEGYKLPDGWNFALTSNRMQDRAGVTPTPMQAINRVSIVEVEAVAEGWDTWASKRGMNPLYIAAMQRNPNQFISSDVPAEPVPFCTPRSFVYAHDVHMASIPEDQKDSGKLPLDDITGALITGLIGPAAAPLFSFLENHQYMATQAEILADPEKAKCPSADELGAVYATGEMVLGMVRRHKDDSAKLNKLWKYTARLPEMYIMTFAMRAIDDVDTQCIINCDEFTQWLTTEENYRLVEGVIMG